MKIADLKGVLEAGTVLEVFETATKCNVVSFVMLSLEYSGHVAYNIYSFPNVYTLLKRLSKLTSLFFMSYNKQYIYQVIWVTKLSPCNVKLHLSEG